MQTLNILPPCHRQPPRLAPSLLAILKSLVLLALIAALAFWITILLVPLPERLHPPTSRMIPTPDGTAATISVAADHHRRLPTNHRLVDPNYLFALLALEDQRFFDHPGVDLPAILRAAHTNASRGRVVSGASTLTMQLVRMAEPRPRTLRSKLIEAFRALQIEYHHSKEEILDLYLTLLPFGPGLEGLQTASHAYFGHDASQLSSAEIATLLAIPQAPAIRHPSPSNHLRLTRARNTIALRLLNANALPTGIFHARLFFPIALASIHAESVPIAIRPSFFLSAPPSVPTTS